MASKRTKDWTKDADYIHYSAAVASVVETTKNIISAEKSLYWMDVMKIPVNDPGRMQTVKEIKYKNYLLGIYQMKVKRSMKRITQSDRITFASRSDVMFPKFEE